MSRLTPFKIAKRNKLVTAHRNQSSHSALARSGQCWSTQLLLGTVRCSTQPGWVLEGTGCSSTQPGWVLCAPVPSYGWVLEGTGRSITWGPTRPDVNIVTTPTTSCEGDGIRC